MSVRAVFSELSVEENQRLRRAKEKTGFEIKYLVHDAIVH